MYKTALASLALAFSFMAIAPSLQAQCKLCDDNRERNKQNPSSGYTYYEDYLKAQQAKKAEPEKKPEQQPAAPQAAPAK